MREETDLKRLLYFVSNSKNKYEELKQMAEGTSYDIRWYQYSIKELQTDKVEELLRHQGIFSTYLENEYALIALALEKAKDENGKNLYNRMFIYQWIENIRKLGLQLSFAKPESSNLEKFIDKIPECVHQ